MESKELKETESQQEKVLFLMAPEGRHLVVELDQNYTRRELDVMLTAFRKRLVGLGPDLKGSRRQWLKKTPEVNRIIGPGFVIEMLR